MRVGTNYYHPGAFGLSKAEKKTGYFRKYGKKSIRGAKFLQTIDFRSNTGAQGAKVDAT